jgi:protein associated with RNAse G/E
VNVKSDEQKKLFQDILVNNYPRYFFYEDNFNIIGNIHSNGIIYTICYNEHVWGESKRMTGRLVIFIDYNIIGQYGVINEEPEIIDNEIRFKDVKHADNFINFQNGIPEKILINGELHSFQQFVPGQDNY